MPFSVDEWDALKNLTWADLMFALEFAVVRIKFTKTRQLLDEPLLFPIARQAEENPACAVEALELLQSVMMQQDPALCAAHMPVFQSIDRSGRFTGRHFLKDQASQMIKDRCTDILGTPNHSFSGRSCRITGATLLVQMGISEALIGWLGDWRDSKHWRIYAHTPLPELLNLTKTSSTAIFNSIKSKKGWLVTE